MDVDKAGRDGESPGIDTLGGGGASHGADLGDSPIANADVGIDGGMVFAIEHRAPGNDQVVLFFRALARAEKNHGQGGQQNSHGVKVS